MSCSIEKKASSSKLSVFKKWKTFTSFSSSKKSQKAKNKEEMSCDSVHSTHSEESSNCSNCPTITTTEASTTLADQTDDTAAVFNFTNTLLLGLPENRLKSSPSRSSLLMSISNKKVQSFVNEIDDTKSIDSAVKKVNSAPDSFSTEPHLFSNSNLSLKQPAHFLRRRSLSVLPSASLLSWSSMASNMASGIDDRSLIRIASEDRVNEVKKSYELQRSESRDRSLFVPRLFPMYKVKVQGINTFSFSQKKSNVTFLMVEYDRIVILDPRTKEVEQTIFLKDIQHITSADKDEKSGLKIWWMGMKNGTVCTFAGDEVDEIVDILTNLVKKTKFVE